MNRQFNTALSNEENLNTETQQNSTDWQFMAAFENCTLPPECFNHDGHVKITWLYLQTFPIDTAVDKVMVGIKAYAEHLGAKEKYHATLTWFMVHLVKNRISSSGPANWEEFKMQHQDLFINAKALVEQYYSGCLIASEKARKRPVLPDIMRPDWLTQIGEK